MKVKYAIVFLFLLGSTLSISISPILAASDIDNDGIDNEDDEDIDNDGTQNIDDTDLDNDGIFNNEDN